MGGNKEPNNFKNIYNNDLITFRKTGTEHLVIANRLLNIYTAFSDKQTDIRIFAFRRRPPNGNKTPLPP